MKLKTILVFFLLLTCAGCQVYRLPRVHVEGIEQNKHRDKSVEISSPNVLFLDSVKSQFINTIPKHSLVLITDKGPQNSTVKKFHLKSRKIISFNRMDPREEPGTKIRSVKAPIFIPNQTKNVNQNKNLIFFAFLGWICLLLTFVALLIGMIYLVLGNMFISLIMVIVALVFFLGVSAIRLANHSLGDLDWFEIWILIFSILSICILIVSIILTCLMSSLAIIFTIIAFGLSILHIILEVVWWLFN